MVVIRFFAKASNSERIVVPSTGEAQIFQVVRGKIPVDLKANLQLAKTGGPVVLSNPRMKLQKMASIPVNSNEFHMNDRNWRSSCATKPWVCDFRPRSAPLSEMDKNKIFDEVVRISKDWTLHHTKKLYMYMIDIYIYIYSIYIYICAMYRFFFVCFFSLNRSQTPRVILKVCCFEFLSSLRKRWVCWAPSRCPRPRNRKCPVAETSVFFFSP